MNLTPMIDSNSSATPLPGRFFCSNEKSYVMSFQKPSRLRVSFLLSASIVLSLLFCAVFCCPATAVDCSGSGTVNDPYVFSLSNSGQWNDMADFLNSKNGYYVKITLKDTFDKNNSQYVTKTIGTESNAPYGIQLEGNNQTLRLNIDGGTSGNQGLFGYVKSTAADSVIISNLKLTGSVKGGSQNVGGLIGKFEGSGKINNVIANDLSVDSSGSGVGGVIGNISNSSNLTLTGCEINGGKISSPSGRIGGIIGLIENSTVSIVGCVSRTNVISTSGSTDEPTIGVGGLIGYIGSGGAVTISMCFVDCPNISGSKYVSGLVGELLSGGSLNGEGETKACLINVKELEDKCHTPGYTPNATIGNGKENNHGAINNLYIITPLAGTNVTNIQGITYTNKVPVPTNGRNELTYNGQTQTYIPVGFIEKVGDKSLMAIYDNNRKDANTYDAIVMLDDDIKVTIIDGGVVKENVNLIWGDLSNSAQQELPFTIKQKPVSLKGVVVSPKTYDGTVIATITGWGEVDGKCDGDDVYVKAGSGSAQFADKTAGKDKQVTLSGFVLEGSSAKNYMLSQSLSATGTITPKPVTITGLSAQNKTYDGTKTCALTGTAIINGVIQGDEVGYTATSGQFDDKDAGVDKTVIVNSSGLTGKDAGNYSADTSSQLKATITPKEVTAVVTVKDKEYDGTNIAAVDSKEIIGLVSGDNVSLTEGSAFFEDEKEGNDKKVTFTKFSLNGPDKDNYTLPEQPAPTTANIIAKDLSKCQISNIYDQTYTGSPIRPQITIYDGGNIVDSAYYSVEYSDNTNPGTATVFVTGIGKYTGNLTTHFKIDRKSNSSGSNEGYSVLLQEQTPDPTPVSKEIVVPNTQPIPTDPAKSPIPIIGILSGLGVATVIFTRRIK